MDNALLEKIKAAGQLQLLRFYDELSPEEKSAFDKQLAAVNWESLPALAADYVLKRPETAIPDDLAPAEFFPLDPPDAEISELYKQADAEGKALDSYNISDVEKFLPYGIVHCLVFARADLVPVHVNLNTSGLVLKFAE